MTKVISRLGVPALVVLLGAAGVACKGDKDAAKAPAGSGSAAEASDAPGLGGLGGLGGDPIELLKQIGENLQKPGPYEAPAASPGYQAGAAHWAVLALSGAIVEVDSYDVLGGGVGSLVGGGAPSGIELRALTSRLRALAADASVTGLLLRVDGLAVSLPDAMELRAALADVRAAGKQLVCHTEAAGNAEYLVLTACARIGLAPLGQVVISGPAAMPIHLKGLLDKLGITADFLHVGAYKGAAEPLTRDEPSAEMREVLGNILDGAYATMVDTIAAARGLPATAVRGLIDEALFPAEQAVTARLVDEVAPFEAFRDAALAGAAWTRVPLEPEADPMASAFKLMRFLGAMPAGRVNGPHVALVYAVGNVVDGGGGGTIGARQEIASHTVVAALRTLASDDDVKAVVLRIDSGGGSALASELIFVEVQALAAKKPVIVSMSDLAASGGYYIAASATKIFAMPDTLTGSIGVVGGKLAPGGALAKLGVTSFPMGRGRRATMMASLAPWSADERAAVQATMTAVYDTFVARVAAGRKQDVAAIRKIAQGRVWTGTEAKRLGLVDELGGLDAALAEAYALSKLSADTTVLEVYPASPTLRDFVSSFGGGVAALGPLAALGSTAAPPGATRELALLADAVSPQAAAVVGRTLEQLVLLSRERVATVALWPVAMY